MDSSGLEANLSADEEMTNLEVDDQVGEGLHPDRRSWAPYPNRHRQHWAFRMNTASHHGALNGLPFCPLRIHCEGMASSHLACSPSCP